MITVGTTPADGEKARAIAHAHPQVWYSVGIHPHYGPQVAAHELPRVVELAGDERCVAFGEMGVDYHYDKPPRKDQCEMFSHQLEMVKYSRLGKPVIIHCRKAVDDVLSIIAASGLPGNKFVFHCFTEPVADARRVLDMGAMISFTGIATYKNAPEVREAAKLTPDDRIMIETDAPYLTPEPHRKVRTNEPRYVGATARFLAELRGVSFEKFVETTDGNAVRFFGLGGGKSCEL